MTDNDNYSLKFLNVHCASCVKKIEEALSSHLDKEYFHVNFVERRVDITVMGKAESSALISTSSCRLWSKAIREYRR